MAEEVCIELLGDFRVRLSDGKLVVLGPQKAASLLAFLAFHPDRSHTREELVDRFWPDATHEGGRSSLRSALSTLRRELEPAGVVDFLEADRQYVGLDRGRVTTDIRRYEAAVRQGRKADSPAVRITALEEAAALYRGPLLSGFYDDWIVVARENLQQQQVRVLRDLSAALSATGDPDRARDYALRVLEIEPLDEENHAVLMRLLASEGQAAALTRQFRDLERRLQNELGTTPSAGIRALYERLLSEAQSQATVAPGPLPIHAGGKDVALATTPPAAPLPKLVPLPPTFNRFFGREAELERLLGLLSRKEVSDTARRSRLVTLTGPGGSGKTRLAAEVGRKLQDSGVAVGYAPLMDITRADLLPMAILQAMGGAPESGSDLRELVKQRLESFDGVLILDNFEQIAEEGAGFVHTLLETSPLLRLLITSRQVLGLGGEQEISVSSLPVPQIPGVASAEDIPASVRLFVDRAQAMRADFALTRENTAVIAAICERLDGIPLALELAAAWIGTLTPTQLLARLDDRFRLLTSRRKDLPERHRTLRSAIESSFQELEPAVGHFFASLSVFRDGASLEAVEVVSGEPRALEFLSLLRERSLLAATPQDTEMRFRLLETLREYGRSQLSPEERSDLERRHALYFRDFAVERRPVLMTPSQKDAVDQIKDALDRLDADLHNLRAALEWAATTTGNEAAATACTLALSLYRFWAIRGHMEEGRRWFGEVVARGPEGIPPRDFAGALYYSGSFDLAHQDIAQAEQRFRLALDLFRTCGDEYGVVNSICRLGMVQSARRDFSGAEQTFLEGRELARVGGYVSSEGHILKCLGVTVRELGRVAEARRYFDEGLSLARIWGDPHGISMMLGECASIALVEGDLDRAEKFLQEQLPLSQTLKAVGHEAHALSQLALLALRRGQYAEAATDGQESLRLSRTSGDQGETVRTLVFLTLVYLRLNDPDTARTVLREAAEFYRRWEDIAELHKLLFLVAALAAAEGHQIAAAQIWGAADALTNGGGPGDTDRTAFIEEARQHLQAILGDARFTAEYDIGQATPRSYLDHFLIPNSL